MATNIALSLQVLLLLAVSARAEAAVPHSIAELRQIVADALATGTQRVVVPPGIYRGEPADGQKVHWTLKHTQNLDIVAAGVTMVCTKRMRAIDFVDCRNVTLQGLTIDYDPLTFTQGRVVIRYAERNAWRANLVADAADWRWSSLWIREHGTKEQRGWLSAWPVPRPRDWRSYVNRAETETEAELQALRHSVRRGTPYGSEGGVSATAERLGLQSTLRPGGRPRKPE